MLTAEQQYVLRLLRRSLGAVNESANSEGIDPFAVVAQIRRNGILLTVWPELQSLPKAKSTLELEYYAALAQSVNQGREAALAIEALTSEGLRCIALKGMIMRNIYPVSGMRQMADVDVLIKPYNYSQVRDILVPLGYMGSDAGESSWKHDSFKKGVVHIEAHKRLTDDSALIRDWEEHMWKRASCDAAGVWHMSDVDFFVFHIVHMYKDIMNGSLGLRRIADTWLIEQDFSSDVIKQALIELGDMDLDVFAERMLRLGRACMGDVSMDTDSELLLRHAFAYGIYGSEVSYKAGRIASMSHGSFTEGKVRSALAAVFLPYSRMKAQFPELEHKPILLPFCWGKRIVRSLRGGGVERYRSMMDYGNVTKDDFAEMRSVLKAAGCIE